MQTVSNLLKNIKQTARSEKSYGGKPTAVEASTNVRLCPNCGAGRAREDGLTHCAYCGFRFIDVTLGNGIFINEKDNSK